MHALVVGSLTASVIIEFFCGTARYTQSLLQLGVAAIGIDVLMGVDMSTPGMFTMLSKGYQQRWRIHLVVSFGNLKK